MYEIKAKEYYEGKNETQIRIQQENPWRDFIIFLKGAKALFLYKKPERKWGNCVRTSKSD